MPLARKRKARWPVHGEATEPNPGGSVPVVTHDDGLTVTPLERRALLAASVFALTALGALQALWGPAFPALMDRYGVGIDTVGTTVMLHFIGGLTSTLAAPWLLPRFGYRRILVIAGIVAASGMTLAALAPTWSLLLTAALMGGLGFGLTNTGLNILVTRTFTRNAAPYLNLLSALFGVGAILGPIVVAAVTAAGVSLWHPFLGLAGLAALATLFALATPNPRILTANAGARTPWLLALGFAAIYLVYVGTESSVAAWETVHLKPFVGAGRAAALTSLFWIMLTLGRFAIVPIASRFKPRYLVLGASAATLVALAFTHIPSIAPFAYAAAGFVMAPIFPTAMAWISAVFPKRREQVIPLALGLGAFGPIGATALIGAWAAGAGTQVIPTALTLLGILLLLVAGSMVWATRSR